MELLKGDLHLHGGADRSLGIVVPRPRGPEDNHHAVAGILVERAAVFKDQVRHLGEKVVEQLDHGRRLHLLRHPRKPPQIDKHYRHLLAFASQMDLARVGENPFHGGGIKKPLQGFSFYLPLGQLLMGMDAGQRNGRLGRDDRKDTQLFLRKRPHLGQTIDVEET